MAEQPVRLPLRRVAARFAHRLIRYLFRDRSLILLVSLVAAMWFVLPAASGPASSVPDVGDQYFRALQERDPNALFNALSPNGRRALEVRFGRTGSGAAAAFFQEQDSQGERVIGWERIGAYRTVQGDELRYYVVHYAHGDERRDVPYVLVIDANGKIAGID
jgi:hypothetical protein